MHAATKVMFALGGVICLIGIVMWVGGAEAAEMDIEEEADWSGTSGDWYHDDDDIYLVYVKEGTTCETFSATMTDENGSTGSWIEDYMDIDACDEWDTEDLDGFILAGSIGFGADRGNFTIDASDKIYIIGAGEELGEAIGGGLAILGSWGVLCCGGFFLLLGGIFALTLKKAEPQVVVVNQAAPAFAAPAATQMAAPQYEQPQQYQQVQQPQQYQQPPQGGI